MKILHLIRRADPRGGGPIEGIRRHAELSAAAGTPLTVVSFDEPDAVPAIPGTVTIGLGSGLGNYGVQRGAVARLRELARQHDIVVVNGLWQYHSLAAHRACRGQTPYVVFPHGMLGHWFNDRYPLKALKKKLYWRLFEHAVVRDAAAVCFTTDGERIQARTSFQPYHARETVVGYGTAAPPPASAAQREAFAASCPRLAGRHYLLFLSRIHEVKGCDLLIQAFAALAARRPELDLVLAGPDGGNLRPGLERLATSLGIAARIHWPGMLQGDAKWGAFRGADAFVLPSHHENFGVAVAEALACGVPALVSDQVGIASEVVSDGGGLAAPDTAAGTTDLLARWDRLTIDERSAMRAAAVRCFTSRFAVGQAVAALEGRLAAILAGEVLPQHVS